MDGVGAAGAGGGGSHAHAAIPPPPAQLGHQIQQLKERKKELVRQRKTIAKDLRNAERRQSRLKKRTRLLTDADLHQVLRMRGAPPPTEAPVPPSAEEAAPPP